MVFIPGYFCFSRYCEGDYPPWFCCGKSVIDILELYGSISAGLYGSESADLMEVDREMVGEWRSAGDSRVLRTAWGAPEDRASRKDGSVKGS